MYEERKRFSIKDIIIQLLFVVLFVFILIWLFPTKGYLKDKMVSKDELINSLEVLYGQAFANNLNSMKESATSYFTAERLPKNVGDSVKLTLGEMLDKKLVLEFKDSNNQACDATKSYVELTKMDNEYQMKVQLTCSDYTDYIIAYNGCYAYCENECEKPVTKPTNTAKPTQPSKPNTPDNPKPVVKTYKYEYRKTWQNEWSNWSNWSNWTTTKQNTDTNKQVEIKKEIVFNGYTQIWGIVGYKDITYYEDKVTGGVTTDTKEATKVSSNGYYTSWVYSGTARAVNGFKYNTTLVKYELIDTDYVLNCNNNCVYDTVRIYNVYKRNYVAGTTSYNCNAYPGYTLSGTKCVKTINTSTTEKVPVIKKEPIYGYTNGSPVYTEVTYYRYRTRTLIKQAGTDTKWSTSQTDKGLLDQGYVLTGKYEEV